MDPAARIRLRRHLTIIDEGVAPVVHRYRRHIQCERGCSECCHQTFRVSEVEGALLREGLAELRKRDPTAATDIEERARTFRADARQPCPVLDADGACRLYRHRPRICRKYGIPLWSPSRPGEVRTCPKNFRDQVDLAPDLILDPQADWAKDWIETRRDLALGPQRDRTIARWLLA